MRKIGATGKGIHRLLALVLAFSLCLGLLPASGETLAGWDGVQVSVLHTDGSGSTWQYPAVRVPDEFGLTYTWWVTLPETALDSVVQLQVVHPDPAYTYWAPDWTLNLHWNGDKNAAAVDDLYTYYIGYSYNGAPQVSQMNDCMKILLSTQEPPFAYESDVLPGGAVMLPAGGEGFGSEPGVEVIQPGGNPGVDLIIPGGSQGSQEQAPATAVIPVYYVHEDGRQLDMREVTLGEGTHTLWPESDRVGGLNLVGEYSQTVTVHPGGWTDVASVTFYYADPYVAPQEPEIILPVTASVDVYYYHQDGYELDHRVVTLEGEGTHYIYPESSVAAQYELVSEASHNVYVNADGYVDLASVSFIYRTPYVAPVTGELTVMYVLEDGTRIDSQVVTVAQGNQTVWPESSKVGGLTLVSQASFDVYVDNGGAVSPNPVTFVYRQPVQQVQEATLTVRIYDSYMNEIASPRQYTLPVGTHIIEAPAGSETPGYELISEAVIEVTVHADGSYTPSGEALSFWYRPVQEESIVPVVTDPPAPQTASVTLRYLDSRGYEVAPDQVVALGEGTHTLTPDQSHVPAGYTAIAGTDSHQVTVRNGRANQSVATFYFTQTVQLPVAPQTYQVTVHYYDTLGNEIAPRQTLQLAPGTHLVKPSPQNLPSGYQLASESSFYLTVYQDGTMDRAAEDVGFWYAREQVQVKNAVITIRYVDGTGRLVAGPFTQELQGGQTYQIFANAADVPQTFDVSGAEPVTVTVSETGYASPQVVSFLVEYRRSGEEIPVGVEVRRYGVVNANSVAMRTEPYSTKSNTVIQRVQRGGMVYLLSTHVNNLGEKWTEVIVNGRTGYMKTEFIDLLTPEASDAYASSIGATPVPTFTPEPTESIVEIITPVPVTPAPYAGYAVLQWQTELRTGASSDEMSITALETDEMVLVNETIVSSWNGESWSYVRTMDGLNGYVPAYTLRQISDQEAAWRLQQYYATPAPTQLVTNTPEPMQLQGYGLTTAANVPLRRMASELSSIDRNLPYGTVVYITGQTYADGVTWQNVAVDGRSGYIRSDLVRFMTEYEEMAYLNSFNTAIPTATPTSNPYSSDALSSYGYVTKNAVNFREGASTGSRKLASLNAYAMALVLGTERVGGVTWYRVNYNGETGYIHGSYFHQMTLKEFSEFYGSDLYYQGLRSNEDSQDNGNSTGGSNAGGQVSQEDYVVDDWYASGNVIQPSFAPFVPVPTEAPINATATPTLEPLPGYVTQGSAGGTGAQGNPSGGSGQVSNPSDDLPLPGATGAVTYPMKDSGGDGSALVWVIVIALLVLAVGGAVAVMQHQRRKQQIAMKAAQRRAQQARNAAAQRPYARVANPVQPRTGAYPNYGQQQLSLFPQPGQTNAANDVPGNNPAPTASASPVTQAPTARPYARPAAEATPQRVGRRTAWQQAHAEQNDANGDN
ncbi:MAG: SH3 domain-containing protein [Clostridia bacterium]|nr:SH3 domain-containing protein [Clostridia bacterium]